MGMVAPMSNIRMGTVAPMSKALDDLDDFLSAAIGTVMLGTVLGALGHRTFEDQLRRRIDDRLEEIRRERVTLAMARGVYASHATIHNYPLENAA